MDFKFEIGSVVRLALSRNQVQDFRRSFSQWGSERYHEMRGMVIGRATEECSGGVQRLYRVRWIGRNGSFISDLHLHNEIELVASEPFPSLHDEDDPESKDDSGNKDAGQG